MNWATLTSTKVAASSTASRPDHTQARPGSAGPPPPAADSSGCMAMDLVLENILEQQDTDAHEDNAERGQQAHPGKPAVRSAHRHQSRRHSRDQNRQAYRHQQDR